VLTVADSGIGIPAHELPRLFDRFHRIEGSRGRTHEGTGIGLALVQELARLHGGTVRVESSAGRGSAFTVTIPMGSAHLPKDRVRAARAEASAKLAAQPFVEEALRWLPDAPVAEAEGGRLLLDDVPEPRDHPARIGRRALVLLADDNADMRDYVRRLLSQRYDVRSAGDGAQALSLLRAGLRPDLLLSDVMMPELDGVGLVRAVRAEPTLAALARVCGVS
jgi:hypothetical protein